MHFHRLSSSLYFSVNPFKRHHIDLMSDWLRISNLELCRLAESNAIARLKVKVHEGSGWFRAIKEQICWSGPRQFRCSLDFGLKNLNVLLRLSFHFIISCANISLVFCSVISTKLGERNPNNVYFQWSHVVFKSSSTTEMSGDVRGYFILFFVLVDFEFCHRC